MTCDLPRHDPSGRPATASPRAGAQVAKPVAPFQHPGRWLLAAAALLLLGAASFAVDCQLAGWSLAGNWPRPARELFNVVEPFGHGLGALVILVALGVLDPSRRWALPRVAALSLGAGMLANIVKLLVVRTRPRYFGFEGDVWTTFGAWLPLTSAGSTGQSFPSGHTATAVGLAIALCWLYPQGCRLFAGLAVLVALQRIHSGAHFLSDTLVSAGLAVALAVVLFHFAPVGRWFADREARWRSRWTDRQAGNRESGEQRSDRPQAESGPWRRRVA